MMTLGLSPALGSAPVSAPAGPNPNLLLWSEALDNAAWTKTACTIVPDQDGTADELASTGATCALRQVTNTASTSGAAVTAVVGPHPAGYVNDSLTGTFDGLPYTLTMRSKDAGGGESVTLRIDRSGGFLRASVEDPSGAADILIAFLQLEQAGAFTTYHRRDGT